MESGLAGLARDPDAGARVFRGDPVTANFETSDWMRIRLAVTTDACTSVST